MNLITVACMHLGARAELVAAAVEGAGERLALEHCEIVDLAQIAALHQPVLQIADGREEKRFAAGADTGPQPRASPGTHGETRLDAVEKLRLGRVVNICQRQERSGRRAVSCARTRDTHQQR